MRFRSKRPVAENSQHTWPNQQHFSRAGSLLLAAILCQLLGIALVVQVLQFHGLLLWSQGLVIAAVFILLHYMLVLALVGWIMANEARRFMLDEQKRAVETAHGFLQVVRAQRHDLVNHLQALAALFQTGREEMGRKYLGEMIRVGANANEAIQGNDPVLAAFLQVRVHQAAAQGVDFELDVENAFGPLPVSIAYALVGVLGNLLDNAFETVTPLPAAQRKVMCAIAQYDKYLIVRISDSGLGIAPEHRERIFNPDFSTRGTGRGQGLALVWEVVTGIGGRVEVGDNPTTFTVWFPLRGVAP